MLTRKLLRIFYVFTFSMVIFHNNTFAEVCQPNPKLQQARSSELQRIVNADQKEREITLKDQSALLKSNELRCKLIARDLARRKRVAEIFAEGYIKSAKDYLAAALVYQHGDVPDHYYQAYIWAKKAAELGDKSGQGLAALAIDRYLINTGRKQLFGSQAFMKVTEKKKTCFCIQDVEASFPDTLRKEYLGLTLKEQRDFYMKQFAGQEYCSGTCGNVLKPTPKGTVPGLW